MSNRAALVDAIKCSSKALRQEQLTLDNLKRDLGKLLATEAKFYFNETIVSSSKGKFYVVTDATALNEDSLKLIGVPVYYINKEWVKSQNKARVIGTPDTVAREGKL